MGDCIVSLPALEALRGDYTEVWTTARNRSLIRFADRVEAISSTGLDLLELPEIEARPGLVERLRGFDSIVSWYGSNRAAFRERGRALHLPFTFFPALPESGAGCHAVDFYLRQAESIGGAAAHIVPRIACEAEAREIAVIHPFSGSPRKNWPLERFRAVARMMERAGLAVVWTAGPEEELDGAVRVEDLYELGRLIASARVYLGNDSGISHLAAAVGTATVALFGPTDPAVWEPRGRRVCCVATDTVGEPMERIGVGRVAEAVFSLLM